MGEPNTLGGLATQCAVLIALGASLAFLVRALRFQGHVDLIAQPRSSSLWALAAIFIGWILVSLLLSGGGGGRESQSFSYSAADVVAQVMLLGIAFGPVFIVMYRRKERLVTAAVSTHNLGRSLLVGLILSATFIGWGLARSRPPGLIGVFSATSFWALMQFAVVGFVEEFAYRGYLQTRLVSWMGWWQGWILASVLMALAHVSHRVALLGMTSGDAFLSAASLIPISLFLGFVMLRTQNVVAPALIHTFINWIDAIG
jgi:membrane protease YdiL (CAAX protease family)